MAKKRAAFHSAAFVEFAAGVPAYTWQSGEFTGVITDTGVGDITLNYNAYEGVDATECAIVCTAHNAPNPPRRVMYTITHTSDVAKQVQISEEAAAGGASAAADVCFSYLCVNETIV